MFRSFFLSAKWHRWSVLGSSLILLATWYKVQLDVQINEWFGTFYDALQETLKQPGSMTIENYWRLLISFFNIAILLVLLGVMLSFFTKHFIFRWRSAMNDHYIANWEAVRHIEGASQRVQEDTMRFARLMEDLGTSLLDAVLTLVAFLPILWMLSGKVTELPWVGKVPHSLIYVAILFALAGTVLLAIVGMKLPGLEFHNQRVEAAYRKELVLGEDDALRARPPTLKALFAQVRTNNFRLYFHYMYFDVAKWSYLQFGVLVPYIALGPSIIGGALTLGTIQQIVRAFGRVETSFQYLVQSWSQIVELISVYKRLRGFELQIQKSRSAHQPFT